MPRTSASAATFRAGIDQEWLSASYEASLGRASKTTGQRRTQLGAFYTPQILADVLIQLSLTPWLKDHLKRSHAASTRPCPSVLDPACGSGNLLIAAARSLVKAGFAKEAIAKSLHGVDIDPIAVSIARTRIAHILKLSPAAAKQFAKQIRVGDALFERSLIGSFDIVVGNPPFLSQLGGATVVQRSRAKKLLDRFDGVVRGYADMAGAFLVLGAEALKPGGRMAMIEPISVLSASHAEAIRDRVSTLAQLECIYFDRQRWVSASTHVAILAFHKAKGNGRSHAPSLRVLPGPGLKLSWPEWKGRWSAAMAAHAGVPRVKSRASGVIGDRARVAADFRDQYYGLRGAIKDSQSSSGLRIVTTGLIDWAHCMWGEKPVRLLGKAWKHPEVNERAAARDPYMKEWLADARRPKVIVAVQTKVIEAVVDATGRLAPSVPLIRVVPHKSADLWRILAALLSPVTSAEAWWRHAGAGLSPSALKLSAKQVAALPLPTNTAAWDRAANVLRTLHKSKGAAREKQINEFARLAMEAGEVPQKDRAALLAWWRPLITRRRGRN
ncbi:MAG: SAM-dependent methyltransferase [Planctomycetes bacterium]|nr:SAM-dependent methyltransferase [Planctomycetota bacterium]